VCVCDSDSDRSVEAILAAICMELPDEVAGPQVCCNMQVTPMWGWFLAYEYTTFFFVIFFGKFLHVLWSSGRTNAGIPTVKVWSLAQFGGGIYGLHCFL
jgi:hypothetical protein